MHDYNAPLDFVAYYLQFIFMYTGKGFPLNSVIPITDKNLNV